MNAIALKVLLAIGPELPNLITDVQKTITDAQSKADAQVKLKQILTDAEVILSALVKVL